MEWFIQYLIIRPKNSIRFCELYDMPLRPVDFWFVALSPFHPAPRLCMRTACNEHLLLDWMNMEICVQLLNTHTLLFAIPANTVRWSQCVAFRCRWGSSFSAANRAARARGSAPWLQFRRRLWKFAHRYHAKHALFSFIGLAGASFLQLSFTSHSHRLQSWKKLKKVQSFLFATMEKHQN